MQDSILTIQDIILTMQDNIPSVEDNIPTAQDNISIVEDNIPIVQDNIPTVLCRCFTDPTLQPRLVNGWFWSGSGAQIPPTNKPGPGWKRNPWGKTGIFTKVRHTILYFNNYF